MMQETTATPRLLKSRMRHTRLFALLLIPILVFSLGMIDDESPIHELMEWTGYFLIILCVFGRAYCSAFIGGIKNETVMRDGPFSIVRNPLYVFSFLGVVGIGLQSGMISVLVLMIVIFMLYYPVVVAKEEAFLLHRFGDQYRGYMTEVPRWWPKWSLWREPEEMTTRPFFIRHTMMDAIPFFLALPIFELLEALHAQGWFSYLVLP